jgi:hypothetical protein
MLPQIHSAIPLDTLAYFLVMAGFGAYHGLNPGMGWLFALSLGLQKQNDRVIWVSLFPIAAGHAASVALIALIVLASIRFVSLSSLQIFTAISLLSFGIYKFFNYYRHPRWVGMQVGIRDLFVWSFLMATAHGAGLMIIPTLLGIAGDYCAASANAYPGSGLFLAIGVHTLAMLAVMGAVAWIVYKKFSLTVLRQRWINFDLIWAVALVLVGTISLFIAI